MKLRNTKKGQDWIHVAKDRDMWQTLLHTAMNDLVTKKTSTSMSE